MNHTEEYPVVTHNTSDSGGSANLDFWADFWATVELSPYYHAIPVLKQVWTTCFLLLGGFGNVATIFVLHRIKDSNSSQHVFLTALAVADLSCLCCSVLIFPLYYSPRFDVSTLHTATCKLANWITNTSVALSAWFVTAATVQRTLAVTWPHKVRVMCTVRRTWTVVAVLVITAGALWTDELVNRKTKNHRCHYYGTASYNFFLQYIHPWVTLSLRSVLPFVCLMVCDVILSLSLFQATSVANQAISNAPSVHSNNSRRETARRTTVMILALSISFLILTLPVRVLITWSNFGTTNASQIYRTPQAFVMFTLVHRVTFLLMYTNSAINFFLYCFTGTRFRREFMSWIRCGVTDHSSTSVGKAVLGSSKGERKKQHKSLESTLTRN